MHSSTTIRTNDGTRIWISYYTPEESNKKVIVIAPGVGLTHEYYDLFANFLVQHGFVIVTFDYRGMGRSAPENLDGYSANMHQWAVQDINAVLLYAKQHYPGEEIIYIGHCMGGEIIGLSPANQTLCCLQTPNNPVALHTQAAILIKHQMHHQHASTNFPCSRSKIFYPTDQLPRY